MTDKRKALEWLEGYTYFDGCSDRNYVEIIRQALSEPDDGISKDTKTDEKSIIKDRNCTL